MKQAQFTIGAFGIILNSEGNILLCHRTDMDFWNLPGGVLQLSEESDQLEYFSLDQLPVNTIPNHLERIQDFTQASRLILKEQTK